MTVELIGHMGDDLAIVNSARISYHKRSETLTKADEGLIRYLAKNRHGTPFESVVFAFRVRTTIGVAREWFRHRIASYNEESTRYVEMRPDFYVPAPEDVRTQVGKPGAYVFETLPAEIGEEVRCLIAGAYDCAYEVYQRLLGIGVARELARNVLPLGLLTEFICTMNFRSLTNFLSLRTAPDALLEIRREAQEVERLVAGVVPVAYAAWVAGGRTPL